MSAPVQSSQPRFEVVNARQYWASFDPVEQRPRTLIQDAPGGEGGIRTHGTLSRTHAFQACALNHSATSPLERPFDGGRGLFQVKRWGPCAGSPRCGSCRVRACFAALPHRQSNASGLPQHARLNLSARRSNRKAARGARARARGLGRNDPVCIPLCRPVDTGGRVRGAGARRHLRDRRRIRWISPSSAAHGDWTNIHGASLDALKALVERYLGPAVWEVASWLSPAAAADLAGARDRRLALHSHRPQEEAADRLRPRLNDENPKGRRQSPRPLVPCLVQPLLDRLGTRLAGFVRPVHRSRR